MTRGTHSTVEQAPAIGDAIGRYRIIGVLGDGRSGRLYLAEQHGIRGVSKTIALRYIRPELARSSSFRTRFSEAASVVARCEHPSSISIFEMDEVDGRFLIGMEYVPGESVATIVRRVATQSSVAQCNSRDQLPDIAAYVVKQVAAALQYLLDLREASPHRVSHPYGEIDPASVFVSHHGTVKWHALGLRSFTDEAASVEVTPASGARDVGVAERHRGVFELGVLLSNCLLGEETPLAPSVAPREGATRGDVWAGAERSFIAPADLSRRRADVPESLDAILKRALTDDLLERFSGPQELSEALDRHLFRRESRPTPKHLRRWMEQLFGGDRAALQMQIARGRDAAAACARLGALQHSGSTPGSAHAQPSPRPRALWSTSHAVFSQLSRASIAPPRSFDQIVVPPEDRSHVTSILTRHTRTSFASLPAVPATDEPQAPAPQGAAPHGPSLHGPSAYPWLIGATLVAVVAAALGILLVVSTAPERSTSDAAKGASAPERYGRLDVRSTPEGAAVFVDGEPTGLRTPAVLKGLSQGRTIHLRVEKAGFASQERQVSIAGPSVETPLFELRAASGRVHFAGAPPEARVYVDDAPVVVAGDLPIDLSVGSHSVRVEAPGALLFSGRVDVVAGEQTIDIGGDRTTP